MKPLLFLLVSGMAFASPPDAFWRALHLTETSGRLGPIKGDKGKALGPFQIHRRYWEDTKLPGKYEDVADYDYAKQVVTAYLMYKNQWTRDEALEFIRSKRPFVRPNPAFMQLLLEWELLLEETRAPATP